MHLRVFVIIIFPSSVSRLDRKTLTPDLIVSAIVSSVLVYLVHS